MNPSFKTRKDKRIKDRRWQFNRYFEADTGVPCKRQQGGIAAFL